MWRIYSNPDPHKVEKVIVPERYCNILDILNIMLKTSFCAALYFSFYVACLIKKINFKK
jgi:hypothetical protein